eukprot:12992021-Ditylum_brightwellii.AAC.1
MEATSNEPMVSWEGYVEKSLDPLWNNKKDPVWVGQFRPSSIKQIQKTEDVCIAYAGTKFDGLSGKDSGAPPITLTVYKDILCTNLIKNGMWDVFNYVEPKSKSSINLLDNLGQNLGQSGQYLLNFIRISICHEVLKKVPVNASGPEVLLFIISCMATYIYSTIEKFKSKLKKIKISNYP